MTCTAKVTTAEVTDDVVANLTFGEVGGDWVSVFVGERIPDGETFQRQDDRLVRVDLHENGCRGNTGDDHVSLHYNGHLRWPDSLPGATPHDPDVCPRCKGEQLVGSFNTPEDPRRACPTCKGSGRIDDDVTVSDAEVVAGCEALPNFGHPSGYVTQGMIREVILAAKRAERKQG